MELKREKQIKTNKLLNHDDKEFIWIFLDDYFFIIKKKKKLKAILPQKNKNTNKKSFPIYLYRIYLCIYES